MKNVFPTYIQAISSKFRYDDTSEMGYRTEFEILLNSIFSLLKGARMGHDSKALHGNKPDFIVFNKEIPLLYIETKDIGISLDKIEQSEQMIRYYGYANLVLTDYVEFRFYRNGIRYGEPIKIAEYDIKERIITPKPENYTYLAKALLNFTKSHKEPIRSGKHLSKIMGGKAQRIRNDIKQFSEEELKTETDLVRLYKTLRKLLVHDLTVDTFADMYAQTLVYGLFVARYHDKTPDSFSRQEARELIPNSNPFLRHFFDHIVGADFDTRLRYIVDELCDVFSHANVNNLMDEYFKNGNGEKTQKAVDPVIHFYEDFLNEYDQELRKKMGAYYTPQPVVDFIVRSINKILVRDFDIPNGLSDTSKLTSGKHRVQILDPATGTGTFISAIINEIHQSLVKSKQDGRWFAYIHNDLLPRVHGFELMMAPYTIAHLRLGIEFRKMGFWDFHRRLSIYLTNTLEGSSQQQDLYAFGLAESIAEESKEAAIIKNETPMMVIVGNPPYSGESSNIAYSGNDVYKKEPTGGKLQERNSKWLNDDYVKFIRFAESMIEKTNEGIIAMITAHGYIDNPTFRGMRFHLMKTFDEIYILDLHGNTNKKEKAPDGSIDQNVFDIKTGVSIIFGIKKQKDKTDLATIYHGDLYGKREYKFEYLETNTIESIKWQKLNPIAPSYDWVYYDAELLKKYQQGFALDELFKISSVGVVTSRDKFIIDSDAELLKERIQDFLHCQSAQEAMTRFGVKENKKWKIENVLGHKFDTQNLIQINYRPFDIRYIYYHDDFVERSRKEVMRNYINTQNLGLLVTKANKDTDFRHIFVTTNISEVIYLSGLTATNAMNMPLYLKTSEGSLVPNLNDELLTKIKETIPDLSPENLFDYIYAILHSSRYCKEYNEFLKKDYPRVPYPTNVKVFNRLSALGNQLRKLHLLESPEIHTFITSYPEVGSDVIDITPKYVDERVYINENQFFGGVPEQVWLFFVGGYQPAQKWLKDRKGNTLTNAEIEHYQKMIVALYETIKIINEIDSSIDL